MPHFDAVWELPDTFLELPADTGPWGVFVGGETPFASLAGPDELAERITRDDEAVLAWGPDDRHIRPVAEIHEIADAVAARGKRWLERELRERAPQGALAVAILVALIVFWPSNRQTRMLAVLGMIVLWVPLWQRGAERAWAAWRGLRLLRRDPDAWRVRDARRVRFWSWAPHFSSRGALALVVAFVALHLAALWTGQQEAVDTFGLVKPATRGGEWWRLLTSAFLHGGFVHLGFNCVAGLSLANLGRAVVDEFRLLFVFAAAAVCGAIASVALTPQTSVGASGGLLGWAGMLIGLSWRHPGLHGTGVSSSLLRWVLLLAMLGVVGSGLIDNAAHAGGLVAGVGLGYWMARTPNRPLPLFDETNRRTWIIVAALGAVWVWMMWTLLRTKLG